MKTSYTDFLKSKAMIVQDIGKEPSTIHPALFEFQAAIVRWSVKRGRAAIFADVGLGKTIMQLEWSRQINERTLIIAPLAVAQQTVTIAAQYLNMTVHYVRNQAQVTPEMQFCITNYEMLEHFDASQFGAVVLDESSILKAFDGKTKRKLLDMFADTPFRLACTATPAPNDISELGNHAEFLGVMTQVEMQATFFTYDSGDVSSRYRLKKHAVKQFYRWLASWSVAIKKPSDLGFDDTGYDLPELNTQVLTVNSNYTPPGMLPGFSADAISATDAKKVRRSTIQDRLSLAISLISASEDEQWLIWTGLNEEAQHLNEHIADSFNLHGSLSIEDKVQAITDFTSGKTRVLITKSSIAGMGVNMQQCRNMLFFGIDYSWEQFYQAVGRIYRFGQTADRVNVYVITSQQELSVWNSVERKGKEAQEMVRELIEASREYSKQEILRMKDETFEYRTADTKTDRYTLMLGDSCERMAEIPDDSVGLSVYSPPFSDLFVYSATERDLGNSKTLDEFFVHYNYIIRENLRITMPGRLACVHIQDTRSMKGVDGFRGRKDFSGMIIEAYQNAGWIFWQRITIDKNPQAQAIRMKDHGLLFKTLKKDATELSGGHPDYLLVFKKPGDNPIPVTPFQAGEVSADDWILWAHPVWYDIKETNTLNAAIARTNEDEKHLCPLQIDLIERCVKLWSNKGETVFSPFAGIGSELYTAVMHNRIGVGIELNPNYYRVACRNLENATRLSGQTLFEWLEYQQSAGD